MAPEDLGPSPGVGWGEAGKSWLEGSVSTRKTLVQVVSTNTEKADVWSSGEYIRNSEHRPPESFDTMGNHIQILSLRGWALNAPSLGQHHLKAWEEQSLSAMRTSYLYLHVFETG